MTAIEIPSPDPDSAVERRCGFQRRRCQKTPDEYTNPLASAPPSCRLRPTGGAETEFFPTRKHEIDENQPNLYSALSEITSFVGAILRSRRVFPVGAVGNRTYGPDA